MSRLTQTFDRLRSAKRGGLVTYLTAGDPDADRSVELLVAVAQAGADVLEVGVPFSDPLADGPVIQRASERALAGGMYLRGVIEIVRRVRAEVDTPIVLFTYANPVVRMDPQVFARTAADAGVDGVLILDYPIEEAGAAAHAAARRRPRSDLPHQPDDERRADPKVGGVRRWISLRDLAARRHRRSRSPARGRRRADEAHPPLRRSAGRAGFRDRASRRRSRRRAAWLMPPSSEARWSMSWRNTPRRQR